ncbi:tyrosine-type recombinase/integrase [Clostridium oryzae]|uniref:Tyrosine recombinase XerD n=1 Tax=Clostridium oryzae TaxID=1450648 RepID=A0A1V4ILE9_9CLOT|nr:tyrosine-type recombinase/integrase [Clostridium oryzae]OPJ60575.1 tyrosine recombinase XerD [Clostridium oryzae]
MDQIKIQQYTDFLMEKGYSEQTIRLYSKSLEQAPDDWNIQVPAELYAHITKTLTTAKEVFTSTIYHNLKPASHLYFLMITGDSYKEYNRKHPEPTEYDIILNDFFKYSTEFKGITTMSAQAERQHVKSFLKYIGSSFIETFTSLNAKHLRDYICSELADIRPSSKGRYITSLRNFFRFLEYKEISVNHSILELPLAPAEWKKKNVPIILTEDEETRLRNHYYGTTAKDKRNRIIVCLMLDLGMRCAEVAALKITDIQWSLGTLKVSETKNKHIRTLPISIELGHMLEEYIISYRPKINNDYLFQHEQLNNQFDAMSRECVRGIIRRAFEKENIHGWWKGTHALRRTAASHIYNTGGGLKLTADLLGHESLDSTTQYVKVDFESLRKVGSPWPGGDSNE